ncbi:MAG TPA: bifunctional phosphoribosyl-AMP cyclohydrolase/phosphoribosyl-ATP diphosphatase HisIE [Chitinophagaceae bacterium]|nr:bifunctional phosphoribosyl-AMP cyclohydrolase/phosphoribosyl-ATP diphosphatase HisIE [Chitinophagaceae bacterium]
MKIDFKKYSDGLAPAVIQDFKTHKVLTLVFMNEEALAQTMRYGKVIFYDHTKKRVQTKGEGSGDYLLVKEIRSDCDDDAILIKVQPLGPVCNTGADTCWSEKNHTEDFLFYLEEIINLRKKASPEDSYVASLFAGGTEKIAQQVKLEAQKLAAEAERGDKDAFLDKTTDLLFHFLVLLNVKGYNLQNIISVLKARHSKR